jgi:Ca2+-binding RTX toxin-like protein
MPSVTVNGAHGTGYVVVNYDTAAYATLANSLINGRDGILIQTTGTSSIPDGSPVLVGVGNFEGTAAVGLGDVLLTDNNTVTDQVVLTGNDTNLTFVAGAGGGTVLGGDGTDSVTFTSGNWQLNNTPNVNNTTLVGGSGFDVFAAGSGDSTVDAGTGTLFAFGNNGTQTYNLSTGAAYIVAGPGTSVINDGGAGLTTVAGSASSDTTFTGPSSGNIFIAGGGAETLNAAGSTGANVFYAGTGDNTITGGTGNDILFGGSGSSTLTGGGGADTFAFVGQTGASTSTDTISDWGSSSALELIGGVSISSEAVNDQGLLVTLSDNTTITFTGLTQDLSESQVFTFG